MLDKNISKKGHPRNSRRYIYIYTRLAGEMYRILIQLFRAPPDPLIWTRRHHRRRRRRLFCTYLYVYKCIKRMYGTRAFVYVVQKNRNSLRPRF